MTLHELSQLYNLNREIEMNQDQLADLDAEIKKDEEQLADIKRTASTPSSPNYDGMPKSSGYGNKIENSIARIWNAEENIKRKKVLRAHIVETIQKKQVLCLTVRNKLESYIAELPDSLLRMIFTYRFINGLTWSEVSISIGVHTTEDSVKKMCYRYLQKENIDK